MIIPNQLNYSNIHLKILVDIIAGNISQQNQFLILVLR